MATHTVTLIDPRLTEIATVATDDVITNSTGATLVVCTAASSTVGDVVTLAYDAEVAKILPGASYTVLAAQDGEVLYSLNLRGQMTSTVPPISVATSA